MSSETVDLRSVGLAERNTLVSRRFASLPAGGSLELVTDTPPWVLFHQLRTAFFDELDWQLLEEAPDRYHVRLVKMGPARRERSGAA
jgi:uncharacterized protein (DUF2249 family)